MTIGEIENGIYALGIYSDAQECIDAQRSCVVEGSFRIIEIIEMAV